MGFHFSLKRLQGPLLPEFESPHSGSGGGSGCYDELRVLALKVHLGRMPRELVVYKPVLLKAMLPAQHPEPKRKERAKDVDEIARKYAKSPRHVWHILVHNNVSLSTLRQ